MDFFLLEKKEARRQKNAINLIASENFVSKDVLRALGSVFTNKYAEGKSRMRYYAGNEHVDALEDAVKESALKLFGLSGASWRVDVQAYSGSIANLAVLYALVPPGKKIMAMDLSMGGHLTHGSRVSITGAWWRQIPYGVDRKTEWLDYGMLAKIARREKPALIIAGGSAYSRTIDFKKFRAIADSVGAFLMVDMAHIAGLIAGGAHPSPFPYADVVTSTTHKTLRGPRAALIFARKTIFPKIEKAVFPGIQGGPHANAIMAVGVALREARKPSFKKYAEQVVKNARMLSGELIRLGWRVVSGGTDTHLFLLDTVSRGITGKEATERLERAGIIVNKNLLPYDSRKPHDPSGIRIGTPAVTTRGMKKKDMKKLAEKINAVLS
jgi:glycine hydroxymethyltransferase